MTTLQEIIDILRLKASQECQPSMSGLREQFYKGRNSAYIECAEILEKYLKQEEICTGIDQNKKLLEFGVNVNTVWNGENVIPKYNLNGITDFIVSSAYGHIEGEAHTYTPEQWSAHLGFNAHREFRWAYEKDLINFE